MAPSRLSLPLWTETHAAPLAPMTRQEMTARGWDSVDIVFVTGDAYVDHPSFAMAILARVLEAAGFRVAMLSQPDWRSCEPGQQVGKTKRRHRPPHPPSGRLRQNRKRHPRKPSTNTTPIAAFL